MTTVQCSVYTPAGRHRLQQFLNCGKPHATLATFLQEESEQLHPQKTQDIPCSCTLVGRHLLHWLHPCRKKVGNYTPRRQYHAAAPLQEDTRFIGYTPAGRKQVTTPLEDNTMQLHPQRKTHATLATLLQEESGQLHPQKTQDLSCSCTLVGRKTHATLATPLQNSGQLHPQKTQDMPCSYTLVGRHMLHWLHPCRKKVGNYTPKRQYHAAAPL